MRLREITSISEFLEMEEEWNALLERSANNSLPLTHGWVKCWWSVFADGGQPLIVCAYSDNTLVAIFPLIVGARRYRGIPIRMASLMTNMHTPFSDVLIDRSLNDSDVSEVLRMLIASRSEDILQLTCLPMESPAMGRVVNAAASQDRGIGCRPNLITPVIDIAGEWDEFFQTRSKKFRKGLRNKVNRFNRREFKIRRHVIRGDIDEYLEIITTVSRNSWKADAGTDLGTSEDARHFVRCILKEFSDYGDVHLWLAYDGESPMAYELQLVHNKVVYPIRADFDERYRDHAPGSVVEFMALKSIFDEGLACSYFSCADNYPYLAKWSDKRAKFQDVEIFGTTSKAKFVFLFEYKVMPVLRKLRNALGLGAKARIH